MNEKRYKVRILLEAVVPVGSSDAPLTIASSLLEYAAGWDSNADYRLLMYEKRSEWTAGVDREPLPSDGPDYHADHAAWLERNQGPAS